MSQKPGQRDAAFVIVEEVACALQRLVSGLGRREASEAAISNAMAAGEAETLDRGRGVGVKRARINCPTTMARGFCVSGFE